MISRPAASERCILLEGREIAYALRRAKRRTLALSVDARGLRVSVPLRATLSQAEAFIRQHESWILEKLETTLRLEDERRLRLHDGAPLPVLGEDWLIRIETGANRASWGERHVLLGLRPGADPAPVLERALRRRALEVFGQRLAHYGRHLGQPLPPLSLSSARTRWGSCSRISGIRLNWRLIHLPLELVDYVVAHELAHLAEMNHSPRFWAVVESLYPGWKGARAELKALGPTVPRF
ncbi:MAG: SprT family zinc-dependent metalloprotease [Rhodocyclaceae bacterium]|nr:SprT family zinc-dependent metalloprotease [Rhodocyclaceae bacterium]